MADPSIWPKQYHTTTGLALKAFVRWLVDTESLFEIVEAYSSGATVGDLLRVPTALSEDTLDNAAFAVGGTFSWYSTNELAISDWIVLESTNAGAKFQVVFELDSVVEIKHHLIPKADFPVGGADVSPPVLSATSIGSTMGTTATACGFTAAAGGMTYSAICESDSINLVCDNGTVGGVEWVHVGGIDNAHPDDSYPFVINDKPDRVFPHSTPRFNKLSHVDDSLQEGVDATLAVYAGTTLPALSGFVGPGGVSYLYPMVCVIATASHAMTFGLRSVRITHITVGARGTMLGRSVMFLGSNASGPKLAFPWDSTTAYP